MAQTNTVWRFINSTTGKEMDCNDLPYLMYHLRNEVGLDLPRSLDIDLLLRKEKKFVYHFKDGRAEEITIKQFTGQEPTYAYQ